MAAMLSAEAVIPVLLAVAPTPMRGEGVLTP